MAKTRAEISKKNRLKNGNVKHVEVFNIPIHTDLYNAIGEVIKDMNIKNSDVNNLYLAFAYIDINSHNQYSQIQMNKIKAVSNNISSSLLNLVKNRLSKYFRYHPLLKCSFVYKKYSYFEHKARKYKVTVKNDEDITFISAKIMKDSLKEWKIGTKEYYLKQLDNISDLMYQKLMFNNKGEKVSQYINVEKQYMGYHSQRSQFENILTDRFQNNLFVKVDYLKEQVEEMFKDNKINVSLGIQISRIIDAINNKTFTFSHGRMYCNGFHNCGKEWVDKIFIYKDEKENKIKQLFDVKSCFWLFTFLLYSKDAVRDQEWSKLYELIISGDLYIEFQNKNNLSSRDEAKKMLIQWLFSSKKVKVYRREVNKFFKLSFPNFYKWIINRQEILIDDELKSVLSVQCQWYENLLISQLFEQVKDLNTVTLHDAIWISEDQYSEELKNKIEEVWGNIIKRQLTKNKEEKQIQMLMEGLDQALQYNSNYWEHQKEKLILWKERQYG